MEFPCKVELKHNYNSFLPMGVYTAVGKIGDMVIIEYARGWKYVVNRPKFCHPDGKYASIHKVCVGVPGTIKNNGQKMNWKAK